MQTIIMMADLGGHCFWHPKTIYSAKWKLYLPTGAAINIEDLPLSWELNNQLTEWVDNLQYEDNEVLESIPPELFSNNFDMLGRQLWQLVKEELKDKYKVVYYSEVEQKVLE